MMPLIYTFLNYKEFLKDTAKVMKIRTQRGKSDLAKAAGCHLPFLSQVLNGGAHLSLEQAEGIAKFLKMSDDEKDYFFTLILKDRSGNSSLRAYFEEKIAAVANQKAQIKSRLEQATRKALSPDQQMFYYSSWLHAAVHVAVSVRRLNTFERLMEYFGIDENQLRTAIEFLIHANLIEKVKDGYRMQKTKVHLDAQSPMIQQHHTQWRLAAIRESERRREESLQYSSVVSITRKDAQTIKQMLINAIVEAKKVVADSGPEEELFCLNFDFFNLKSS